MALNYTQNSRSLSLLRLKKPAYEKNHRLFCIGTVVYSILTLSRRRWKYRRVISIRETSTAIKSVFRAGSIESTKMFYSLSLDPHIINPQEKLLKGETVRLGHDLLLSSSTHIFFFCYRPLLTGLYLNFVHGTFDRVCATVDTSLTRANIGSVPSSGESKSRRPATEKNI